MKYLLFLGSSLLLASPAHAQLGWRVGGNLLRIGSDSLTTSSRVGYQVGVFYQVPLTERLSLVPEVQLSRERVHVRSGESSSVQLAYQLGFYYLNLPVLARLALGPVYLEAGPQLSWLVGGRGEGDVTYRGTVTGRIDQAATERYRRFDAGACLGIGVKLPANFGLSVRAYQGLGSMLRQDTYPYPDAAIPYAGSGSQHRQTLQASLTYQLAAH
ncbi:MAG: PorT family protein [Hymenobacter sp.]|nr:MAG: PorT family protein [Hymenobacter sp.]